MRAIFRKHPRRRSIPHLSVLKPENPIKIEEQVKIMTGHQDLLWQPRKPRRQRQPRWQVKAGKRLVEQQDRWLRGKDRQNANELLLSLRQFVDSAINPTGATMSCQQIFGCASGLGRGLAAFNQAKGISSPTVGKMI
jgi:hypothetical protein